MRSSLKLTFILFGITFSLLKMTSAACTFTEKDSDEEDDNLENIFDEITVNKEGGFIISPGYDDPVTPRYPESMNHTWLLVAPQNGKIRLLISDMQLEDVCDCQSDYLVIFDGGNIRSKKLAHLCGSKMGLVFSSTGPQMLLMFVTDEEFGLRGFHIEYMIEMGNQCNITVRDDDSSIVSPSYPNNYPDNMDCWTLIKPPNAETRQILIDFHVLKLEVAHDCDYDYVEILDGVTKNAPSLGRFCDEIPDNQILTSSGQFLLHFHSDHMLNNIGFALSYSLISEFDPIKNIDANEDCRWDMEKLNGTISSPNYPNLYDNDEECLFLLEAPISQKIALTMEKMFMDGHEDCKFDHVEVLDGHSPDSKELAKFCGRPMDAYRTVTSTSNKMWVRFVSDSSIKFHGFIARYKVVKEAPVGTRCKYCYDKVHDEELVVVSATPQNVTLSKYQKHIFNCFTTDRTITPEWMKDFVPIPTGEKNGFPGLHIATNHSLVIKSMTWSLEGIYTCTLVTNTDVQVFNAWLTYNRTVQEEKCDIKFSVIPKRVVIVREGSYLFLQCSTSTDTQIKWKRTGVTLTEDTRIRMPLPELLVINPVNREDNGVYQCVARKRSCTAIETTLVKVTERHTSGCGRAIVKSNRKKPSQERGKIVGGHTAVEGANPWQAMLYHEKKGVFCGGSIIQDRWVVTAVHCFLLFENLQLEDVSVRLGKHDRLTKNEPHEQIVKISRAIYHPQYDKKTYDNDIALLYVDKKIEFNDYVQPICLAPLDFLESHVYSKQIHGLVTGWGRVKSQGIKAQFLKEVSLPVVQQSVCILSVKDKNYAVTENMFCAGYAEPMVGDSCQGDSGGPFAVELNQRWYLAGVVSWGDECASKDNYGFYVKAGNYYKWILDTIQEEQGN